MVVLVHAVCDIWNFRPVGLQAAGAGLWAGAIYDITGASAASLGGSGSRDQVGSWWGLAGVRSIVTKI